MKKNKKKNTAAKFTKTEKNVKKTFPVLHSNPRIYIIHSVLALLNILLIIAIISVLVLIRFNSVKNISGQEINDITSFSYFLKRPDLLSSAKALIVFDASAKAPLLSKNPQLRFSPASTAKIMSALVTLEQYNPATILTVDKLTNSSDSSKMGLFIGERISVENLIYGMLLPSGGDAAEVLARNYIGGEKAFVDRMNSKAREIGLKNTHFVDPAGYEDDNYSTAYDLARLGEYALKNPLIREVVKTKKKLVFNYDKTILHNLSNLNELLDIPSVTGIKTGFTNEAEGVLVTSFEYNKKRYIMVVLGSKDRFSDTRGLIEGIIHDLKNESVYANY